MDKYITNSKTVAVLDWSDSRSMDEPDQLALTNSMNTIGENLKNISAALKVK